MGRPQREEWEICFSLIVNSQLWKGKREMRTMTMSPLELKILRMKKKMKM